MHVLSIFKITLKKKSCHMPVLPATQKSKAEGSVEPRTSEIAWAT